MKSPIELELEHATIAERMRPEFWHRMARGCLRRARDEEAAGEIRQANRSGEAAARALAYAIHVQDRAS